MAIELRILSGARAGTTETFDKAVIAVGRHPMSDLRFDAQQDLDVSTRHAMIRGVDGKYSIVDARSTNGTFIHGKRIPTGEPFELHNNDVIGFGEHGPSVAVRLLSALPQVDSPRAAAPVAAPIAPRAPVVEPPITPVKQRRASTGERVAHAVGLQTRRLRIAVAATFVVLGSLAAGIYYKGARATAQRDQEIESLVATNSQLTQDFHERLRGDTLLTRNLQRYNDSLTRIVQQARGAEQTAAAGQVLRRSQDLQRKVTAMAPAVREANDGAVVLITMTLGGQPFEATGFSVSSAGLIVTNRHVVFDSTGAATNIKVKFANTRVWQRARVLKLDDDPTVDLALIKIDGSTGPFPHVVDVATTVDTPVGGELVTLGYPMGSDSPMDGAAAKTTLTMGSVSKIVSDVLQIDSFASHGSSGSPVFDQHGHVIGVVYGGPKEAAGRIVYAVPAPQVAALLKSVR